MSFWDQRYAEKVLAYGDQPNDFIREIASEIEGPRALCIAEGQGRNALFLAGRGLDVTAMDASSVGMARAQELAAERGVSLTTEVGDLSEYELGESRWEVIVAIFAHLPPALRRDVHARVVEALVPGGCVVLEAYSPEQLQHKTGGPQTEELLMTLDMLREEFDGLEFVIARQVERVIKEGPYHDGLSATVQVLARKPVAT